MCAGGGNAAQRNVCISSPGEGVSMVTFAATSVRVAAWCGCCSLAALWGATVFSVRVWCPYALPSQSPPAHVPSSHRGCHLGQVKPGVKCPGASGDEFWGVPAPLVASSLSSSNANPNKPLCAYSWSWREPPNPTQEQCGGFMPGPVTFWATSSWGRLSKLESEEIMLSYALLALKSPLHPL